MADTRAQQDESLDESVRRGEWIDIGNEFAFTRVRKIWTRNGERLEIMAPKLDFSIRLDAIELESLTRQTTESFAKLVEETYNS